MSQVKVDLCKQILEQFYGNIVASVGVFLLKNKASTLGRITQHTSLEQKQVKQALCSLIQQNIVVFSQSRPGVIEYTPLPDAVAMRLRYPHYIHCAKMLFGDAAELLIEEMLLQSQTDLNSTIVKVTKKLNESLVSSGSGITEVSQNIVRDKVMTLIKARLIRRCESIDRDKDDKAVDIIATTDPESLFDLPSILELESAVGSKRHLPQNSEVSAKRVKLETGLSVISQTAQTGQNEGSVYWCVNVHQFHHHFRDQAIIAVVARHIDQQAAEVIRIMLRLSETRTVPTSPESVQLSLTEIFNAQPKDKNMQKNTMDQYLKCLSENCSSFVTKIGESGGGLYQINFMRAMKAICVSQIETIVLERFGSKGLRMFRVLLAEKQVEHKQVDERAMLPPKEAKEILFKMFNENFVTMTELSKTPDHVPARTLYFFNVNLIQVSRMLLEKCYKAAANVMIRRQKCMSDNKRLLDKQDRVEAIISNLVAEGAVEQKEEIEQMVTPSERAQLQKVGEATKMLELSEIQLDNTIFILETFLSYMVQPIPLSKKKDILGDV
uniref:DNA-directed RNA polymerase III subunit RPC3 n=1 Tax=Arion vulgaris TaxID=1028688 RepID=A0A0B7B400_9EUPU